MNKGNKRIGVWAFLAGLGAAIVAGLCCVGPVVLAALGLSSAAALLSFSAYKNLFLALAFLLAGLAIFLILKKKNTCCKPDDSKANIKGKLTLILLVLTTFGLGYALLYNVIGPLAYHQVNVQAQAKELTDQKPGAVEIANFSILTMDCPACALGIQEKLAKMPGIQKAKVNFDQKRAQVVYDPHRLNVQQIKQAIDQTGFLATLLD